MSHITCCLFDLDGVVVDTAKYHYLAWKKLADELGIDFTENHNEKLKGISRMASLDILLNLSNVVLDSSSKEVLAAKKNTWYLEYISKLTPKDILPGVEKFLNTLKNNGIKIGLGSASKNAMTILENLDLLNKFDVIIDGTKVSRAKPNPEVFLKGALALEVDPNYCVVFEDAEAGVEAAINAGMYSIGIGDKKILYKADLVLSGLNEMTLDKLMNLK